MSMISQGIGATSSNFMSIGTANARAKQQRDQYETQARLAEYKMVLADNQAIAEKQQAELAINNSRIARDQASESNNALAEKQRAMMAKSGVTFSGTPLLVAEDQLEEMNLKENTIIYKGYLESYAHENKATMFNAQSQMANYEARVARSTGKYKSQMIMFQKKLTIAKMFYDPGNATSFGEVDNPQQFQHLSSGAVSQGLSGVGKQETGSLSSIGNSTSQTGKGANYYSTGGGVKQQTFTSTGGSAGNSGLKNSMMIN